MKIGFFGDSFCSVKEIDGFHVYSTYIKKLEKQYNANIVSLGVKGSSIYDIILLQLPELLETSGYPDICVFVWTNNNRIFNKKFRSLNISSVFNLPAKNLEVWDAAKKYYNYLLDEDLNELQYKAVLAYFDNTVLSTFPKTTKIIHLWSFETYKECSHRWQHGLEITPSIASVADQDRDNTLSKSVVDPALNHLSGNDKNNTVFLMQ
jgi:hypothetical protein